MLKELSVLGSRGRLGTKQFIAILMWDHIKQALQWLLVHSDIFKEYPPDLDDHWLKQTVSVLSESHDKSGRICTNSTMSDWLFPTSHITPSHKLNLMDEDGNPDMDMLSKSPLTGHLIDDDDNPHNCTVL